MATFYLIESADGCKQLLPAIEEKIRPEIWLACFYDLNPSFMAPLAESGMEHTMARRKYSLRGQIMKNVWHYREVNPDFK